MAVVKKVDSFALDAHGSRVPLLDSKGKPVLVKRGRLKGTPAYLKEPYLDEQGKPRWRATVYDRASGKPVRDTFETEGAAKRWAREQEGRAAHHERLAPDRRIVAEYLTWWLGMKEQGAVKGKHGKQRRAPRSRTVDDYRRLVQRLVESPPPGFPALGRVRMHELTHRNLDALYAAMLPATTAGQVARLNGLLAQAFEEAVRKDYLGRNPADKASVPQPEQNEVAYEDAVSQTMDRVQLARFLDAAREVERDRPFSALWHVLALAGLRPGEAFALRWPDVVEANGKVTLKVHHNLVRTRGAKGYRLERPKTKRAVRDVPLPATAAKELLAWRTRQRWQRRISGEAWQDLDFAFTTRDGTPLHGARRSFERVCAKAELGEWGPEPRRKHPTGPLPERAFAPAFRIYDLRHTCITMWLKAGVAVHVASKLAGHATAAFTLTVYAKALPEQQDEAAEKMEALFSKTA